MSELPNLPYSRQSIGEDDLAAVLGVLRGDWLTTGPSVEAFERALAARCGARHAVVVSSGTAALHLAYAAAGVGPGHEVLTSPLTFAATANAALFLGAEPVFADIDPRTLTLDPLLAATAVTARTRVIAPVDFAGLPADMDAFRALARKSGALVVEDAAHSLGATLGGRPVGALADMTILSFHPVKHITTAEGGAIVTDDDALDTRLRDLRNHGIVRDRKRLSLPDQGPWYYEIASLGWNYRLSDLQCALGLAQLERLDAFLARRRELAVRYLAAFAREPRLVLPPAPDPQAHAWHLFVLRLAGEAPPRRAFFERLRERGLGVQVHYVPVNAHPLYRERGHSPESTPHALSAYERSVSIPLYPTLSDADAERVVRVVRETLDELIR